MRHPGLPPSVGRAFVVGLLVLAASCSSSDKSSAPRQRSSVASPSPSSTPGALMVSSTLDGHTSLPQRIHWEATPSVPDSDVSEVDFLIDGRLGWVEHNAPYFYGDDGGYLVTTFLSSAEHSFLVRVITVGGQSADSTLKAAVETAPAPPGELTGMSWSRTMMPADQEKATSSEPPPTGRWGLTIDSVGWMLHDPEGGGALEDVVYRSPGRIVLRTTIEQPPYPSPTGGAFCEEPDASFVWSYTIGHAGMTLTLHPIGHDPCGDRVAILEGTWTSKGT